MPVTKRDKYDEWTEMPTLPEPYRLCFIRRTYGERIYIGYRRKGDLVIDKDYSRNCLWEGNCPDVDWFGIEDWCLKFHNSFQDGTVQEWRYITRDMALRSAFPPLAEDARRCAVRVFNLAAQGCPEDHWLHKFDYDAAAEIESFAQSRVEPWREAARELLDSLSSISIHPLHPAYYARGKMNALLSDSPAKEATK